MAQDLTASTACALSSAGRPELMAQASETLDQRDHLAPGVRLEREQVVVSRHNQIRLCGDRAFQNPVVGFVLQHVERRAWAQDRRRLTAFMDDIPDLGLSPFEFGLQHSRRFCRDGDGGDELKRATDRCKVRFLSLSAWDGEGGDVDVGVEDDAHNHRPSNTNFSTSASVRTPCLRAFFTP